MFHAVAEVEEVEQLLGFLLCLGTFLAGDQSRNHHVFQRGEFGQKLMKLEHEADVLVAEGG